MDWISPFSSNPSTLAITNEQSTVNNDRQTLFEIESLEIIRQTINRDIAKHNGTENPKCPNETIFEIVDEQQASGDGIPENSNPNTTFQENQFEEGEQ